MLLFDNIKSFKTKVLNVSCSQLVDDVLISFLKLLFENTKVDRSRHSLIQVQYKHVTCNEGYSLLDIMSDQCE